MLRVGVVATLIAYTISAASAGNLIDDKTAKWTDRGVIANTIATAQVTEMRCGLRGQITAALRKADEVNMHFDLNNQIDASDVIVVGTNILARVGKSGWDAWCKKYKEIFAEFVDPQ